MLVTIKYTDTDSLTVEEVTKAAQNNYGKFAQVEVAPESSIAYDHIYFGLQQLITYEQVSLVYDKTQDYNSEIGKLRSKVLSNLTEIVDQVIIDNESRIGAN